MSGWKEVKNRKHELDRATGRDLNAAQAEAASATAASMMGYRLSELRDRAELSQEQVAEHRLR